MPCESSSARHRTDAAARAELPSEHREDAERPARCSEDAFDRSGRPRACRARTAPAATDARDARTSMRTQLHLRDDAFECESANRRVAPGNHERRAWRAEHGERDLSVGEQPCLHRRDRHGNRRRERLGHDPSRRRSGDPHFPRAWRAEAATNSHCFAPAKIRGASPPIVGKRSDASEQREPTLRPAIRVTRWRTGRRRRIRHSPIARERSSALPSSRAWKPADGARLLDVERLARRGHVGGGSMTVCDRRGRRQPAPARTRRRCPPRRRSSRSS